MSLLQRRAFVCLFSSLQGFLLVFGFLQFSRVMFRCVGVSCLLFAFDIYPAWCPLSIWDPWLNPGTLWSVAGSAPDHHSKVDVVIR